MTIIPVMEARRLKLSADLGRGEARHALFEDKAADLVVMGRGFRPDHENIGDRRVGNPRLGAVQPVAIGDLFRARFHAAGIGAGVGLGQAEAAHQLARRELRQIFPFLLLRAVGIDRIHHQRGLHAHHRAVAGIDPLDFARHQPIGDVARARAAILFRHGHAQQPKLAHLAENCAVGLFLQIGVHNARAEFPARNRARSWRSGARHRSAEHPAEAGPPIEMRSWNDLPLRYLPPWP